MAVFAIPVEEGLQVRSGEGVGGNCRRLAGLQSLGVHSVVPLVVLARGAVVPLVVRVRDAVVRTAFRSTVLLEPCTASTAPLDAAPLLLGAWGPAGPPRACLPLGFWLAAVLGAMPEPLIEITYQGEYKVYYDPAANVGEGMLWEWRRLQALVGKKTEPTELRKAQFCWARLGEAHGIPDREWAYVRDRDRSSKALREHCIGTRAMLLVLFTWLHRAQTPVRSRPLVWERLSCFIRNAAAEASHPFRVLLPAAAGGESILRWAPALLLWKKLSGGGAEFGQALAGAVQALGKIVGASSTVQETDPGTS